ncbi:putative transmembrane protein [Apostichopus japonicus]|uniref:Putative transmembrane protein n=1 Tax=Stichopus japonicus TaxID=307972 RepID=A0A2G8JLV3_STIJA|nr:putative transmembrane protein [Apostichopus japonicus]
MAVPWRITCYIHQRLGCTRKNFFPTFVPLRRTLILSPCRTKFHKSEVVKDVVLYKNNSNIFFGVVGAFACAQMVFWGYLTHTAFTSMRDAHILTATKYGPEGPPAELKKWTSWSGITMSLSSGKWRYGVTLLCLAAGTSIFAMSLMYSRRSISSLILLKGGNNLRIETFGFLGLKSSITVPVSKVSCQHSRHAVSSQLPIKVYGHSFHYILDKQGKFLNGRLFDYTAGMKRVLV